MELRKQTLRHGKMHISIILKRSENLCVTKTLDILYSKIHKRGKEHSLSYSENLCRVLLVMTKTENLELSLLSSYGRNSEILKTFDWNDSAQAGVPECILC